MISTNHAVGELVAERQSNEFWFYFCYDGCFSEGVLTITARNSADLTLANVRQLLAADYLGFRSDHNYYRYCSKPEEFTGNLCKLWSLWKYLSFFRINDYWAEHHKPEIFECSYQGVSLISYGEVTIKVDLRECGRLEDCEDLTERIEISTH